MNSSLERDRETEGWGEEEWRVMKLGGKDNGETKLLCVEIHKGGHNLQVGTDERENKK